jgi:microcystin-dependent protein
MDSPFLGMVQYFAFNFVPKGYASANGALLSIQQNAALFALFGTYYGGNGVQTFGVPDLRGRAIIGQANNHTMGEMAGVASVTLLTSNMPAHTHTASAAVACNNTLGGVVDPTGAYPAGLHPGRGTGQMYSTTPGTNMFLGTPTVTVGVAGASTPMSTQNPYLAVTATISTVGIFPSRN